MAVALHHLLQARLINWCLSPAQKPDLGLVDIDAHDGIAEVGETGGGGEPDVTESDYRDAAHRRILASRRAQAAGSWHCLHKCLPKVLAAVYPGPVAYAAVCVFHRFLPPSHFWAPSLASLLRSGRRSSNRPSSARPPPMCQCRDRSHIHRSAPPTSWRTSRLAPPPRQQRRVPAVIPGSARPEAQLRQRRSSPGPTGIHTR